MEANLDKVKVAYEALGYDWIRIQAIYVVDGPRSEVEDKLKFPKTIEVERRNHEDRVLCGDS